MSSPNYIYRYYDLIQTNLENSETDAPHCQFNERRNQEFLKNPEDYKFSITRFMIDTPSLPLFRPIIRYLEPTDSLISPDITVYSITLKLNTADDSSSSQQYVYWETQDETKTGFFCTVHCR
jgi:hypothetical protein